VPVLNGVAKMSKRKRMKKSKLTQIAIPFLIVTLLMAGCNMRDQDGIQIIDVVGNMDNTRDIKLSDIADDVKYIPLETNPECLLSYGYRIVPTKEYFFIADGDKPLFVFDRQGKYVRKIGAIGQGPGEFRNCIQFHLDEEKREVYILNRNKEFMKYSWDGEYISTIEFPYRAMLYHRSDQGEFMFFNFNQMNRDSLFFRLYFTDRELNFTSVIPEKQIDASSFGVSIGAQVWNWNDEILALIELCDTVYKVNEDHLSPKAYMNFGRIRLKKEMLTDPGSFQEVMDNHLLSYNLSVVDDNWGIYFSWEQKTYLGFINPANEQLVFASRIDTTMKGLINDIDGGPGYFPVQMSKGDEWLRPIQAVEFQDMLQNGHFDKVDVEDSEANKDLKEMAARLKENDNPVLMLVKKKKNLTIW